MHTQAPRHFFRACGAALLALLALSGQAGAAGFALITVPADARGPALQGAVWYPCPLPAGQFQIGPFTLPVTRDCAASGTGWPLILVSHGVGASFLSHHDTAAALADAGFAVAAINHAGDNYADLVNQWRLRIFADRPAQITRLLDFMRSTWAGRERLAPQGTGFFGFSRGGYTGLALAGAVPDYKAAAARLCAHDDSAPMCREMRDQREQPPPPQPDARISAFLIADPLNLFSAQSFADVKAPVQLWASEFGGDGVARKDVDSIGQALRLTPPYRLAQGAQHFSFLAPCPAALARELPQLCTERDGFDRTAFHRAFNAQAVAFFREKLGGAKPD